MIKNTILLVSDEAMPKDLYNEVPSRLLSLFTSPVIKTDDIVYPDFVGENAQLEISVTLVVRFRRAPRLHSEQTGKMLILNLK